MSATHDDPDQEIARLTAERDALRIRLEKAIDVRNNLAAWNDDAKAQIAALATKLAQVRQQLPNEKALQRIRDGALGPSVSDRKARGRSSVSKLGTADAAAELCRIIEGIRALVSEDNASNTGNARPGTRPVPRVPRRPGSGPDSPKKLWD